MRQELLKQVHVAMDNISATDREILLLRHAEELEQCRGGRSLKNRAQGGEHGRPGRNSTLNRATTIGHSEQLERAFKKGFDDGPTNLALVRRTSWLARRRMSFSPRLLGAKIRR